MRGEDGFGQAYFWVLGIFGNAWSFPVDAKTGVPG